ncbi:unnamed protein product [Gadus morhua 'NCC']
MSRLRLQLNQPLKIVPTILHGLQGDNRCVNAMGASSSRSVLFGKKKKHKPAVFRALSVLRGALHIKTPKKKKNNNSLLTLHGWGPKKQKKQKREGPFKSWLSLDGKGKEEEQQIVWQQHSEGLCIQASTNKTEGRE